MSNIPIANKLSIRDSGYDEYWLQDQIFENPNCLDLGELEAIAKERQQSSGGRLDILLKNPEDDTMYEVEVMLGETDESHIIRTIEYWDNERRRWPQRQHYAVLVAETITRRFFNVIQLFSQSIPIIAIQTGIIEVNGYKSLFFTKVLDTYEEVDDGTGETGIYDEAYWKKWHWTLETAKFVQETIQDLIDPSSFTYTKYYVGITVNGNNYFRFTRRSGGKSLLSFMISPDHMEEAQALLDDASVPYVQKKKRLILTVSTEFVSTHSDLLRSLTELVKQHWVR